MADYDGALTMRDARARYFAANGFGEGGYDARWVKLKAGPIALVMPNTAERVRSVRLHDLHHVLTQYDTTWTGEAEIGAWEIASSCADHYAAWMLNLWAMAIGLFINPRAVFHAFVRGRHTCNLYRGEFAESLLAPTVGKMRQDLGLTEWEATPTLDDSVAFVVWTVVGVLALMVVAAVMIAPVLVLIAWLVR